MNTHLTDRLAYETRRKLIADPVAYVESVGKIDITTLGHAANTPEGKGTILRLILGATERMPLRALTYVDSALQVARHIPHEQIQIVHANRLGHEVNGVDLAACQEQSMALGGIVRAHISRQHSALESRVLHAEDSPVDLKPFVEIARHTLNQNQSVAQRLRDKGTKHGGDSVQYASAHFAFQDTDSVTLEPLHSDAPTQVRAERIVSIGCQQERTFYLARMAMRSIAMDTDAPMVATAQIFTEHLTPPYFMARGGEPMLSEIDFSSLQTDAVGDTGARRDLAHFAHITSERRA